MSSAEFVSKKVKELHSHELNFHLERDCIATQSDMGLRSIFHLALYPISMRCLQNSYAT